MSERASQALARRGFAVAVLLLSAVVLAEPLEAGLFRLDWSGPSECPSPPEMLARVEKLLGAPVTEVLKVPLTARARVRETRPADFELSLETFQNEQRFTREMHAPSCSELGDAGALVLALAIDPDLRARLPDAELATAPQPEKAPPAASPALSASATPKASQQPAEPPTAKPAPTRTAPTSNDRAKLSWLAGAFVLADSGSIAPFAVGPSVTGAGRLGHFELALDASWLPPRRSTTEEDPSKGGDITLLAFALRPCFVATFEALEPGICAAFELGAIQGEGVGTVARSTQRALWVAAGATFFGRYRVAGPLWLSLRAGLLAPLQDNEFTLENVGVVYDVPALIGRFALGAEAHFD